MLKTRMRWTLDTATEQTLSRDISTTIGTLRPKPLNKAARVILFH